MNTDRKRLLVLASTYPRWQKDHEPAFVHELAKRLTAHYEVTVIAPHTNGSKEEEVIEGVKIKRFRYAPSRLELLAYEGGILTKLRTRPWTSLLVPFFLIGLIFATVRELRHQSYFALHAHWIIPQGLIAVIACFLSRRRPRLLGTSHGADLFGLRGRFATFLKRFVFHHTDCLTVVSSAMLDRAREIDPTIDRVEVIPMGVDIRNRFTPDTTPRRQDQLLFVGRLVEKKGITYLLEAFARLEPSKSNLHLRLIGDGPEKPRLVELARALGIERSVEFVGALRQEALPEHLRLATVFVMPSIETSSGDQEGLGLVQIEAMGCGCPVISSDLPAVRDVIINERNGLLVPPGDTVALANGIQRIMGDAELRRTLSSNALSDVGKFDWNEITQRYHHTLLKLGTGRNEAN